jgi:hypothetical protein
MAGRPALPSAMDVGFTNLLIIAAIGFAAPLAVGFALAIRVPFEVVEIVESGHRRRSCGSRLGVRRRSDHRRQRDDRRLRDRDPARVDRRRLDVVASAGAAGDSYPNVNA